MDRYIIKLLLSMLISNKKKFFFIVSSIFIISWLTSLNFNLSSNLVDSLAQKKDFNQSIRLFAYTSFITILILCLNQLQTLSKLKISYEGSNKLELFIFNLLKVSSIEKIEGPEYNNKLNQLRSSMGKINTYIDTIINAAQQGVLFFIYMFLISRYNYIFPIVVLVFSIPSALISLKITKLQEENLVESSQSRIKSSIYSHILTDPESIKEILIFNARSFFVEKWKKVNEKLFVQSYKFYDKNSLLSMLTQLLTIISRLIVQFILIRGIFKNNITLGNYVVVTSAFGMIDSSIKTMFRIIQMHKESSFITTRISEFEKQFGSSVESDLNPILGVKSIKMKNVSFKYPNNSSYALKNINLEINRGEVVALIGMNGSGKSTLAKIISGLYNISDGVFSVNNVDYKTINPLSYFTYVSLVSQGFYKYPMTISENIFLEDINEESVEQRINQISKKHPYLLQERILKNIHVELGNQTLDSTQISGGQWQRIGITRALNKNSDILIFDEATSELDVVTEKLIIDDLINNKENRITIVVTHNLELTTEVDKVICFANGEITDIGSPVELMSKKGNYLNQYYENFKGDKYGGI